DRYKEAHRRERFSNELALVYVDGGHQATYQDAITSRRARFAGARRLLNELVIGKQINRTLRRVFVEEQLEVPVSLRSGGRAARKEVLFIREERGFNVTGAGGYGLPEF